MNGDSEYLIFERHFNDNNEKDKGTDKIQGMNGDGESSSQGLDS